MSFDTEKFIKEVEARPCLWNNNTPEFENKSLKTREWKELCDTLVPNYPAMDSAAKNREIIGLQRKWKSLRDSFNRELKARRLEAKASGDPDRKPCPFFDQLSFLKPILEAKMRDSPEDPAGEDQEEEEKPEQEVPMKGVPAKRKRTISMAYDAPSSPDDMDEVKWLAKGDNDLAFFNAIIPYMKKMPENSRHSIKMSFLAMLKKYINRKVTPPIVSPVEGSSRTTPATINGSAGSSSRAQEQPQEEEEEDVDMEEQEEYPTTDTSPGLSAGYTDESVETEDERKSPE